jgi:hypothetical protein
MNLLILYTLFSQANSSVIPTKKICRDCIHFIGDNRNCRKFSNTNLITGEVTYRSALDMRTDEKMCGEDAIQFEENQLKIITVPYYFIKEYWLLMLPVEICVACFFALYYESYK